jgi:hypothetical protein
MLSAIFFVFLVVMVLGETLVGEVDGCCPLTDGWRSDVLYLDVVERWKWSCCEDCYFFFLGGGRGGSMRRKKIVGTTEKGCVRDCS